MNEIEMKPSFCSTLCLWVMVSLYVFFSHQILNLNDNIFTVKGAVAMAEVRIHCQFKFFHDVHTAIENKVEKLGIVFWEFIEIGESNSYFIPVSIIQN